MPRFCSEDCRSNTTHDKGHFKPHIQIEAMLLKQRMDYMPQPLWHLPHKKQYEPFRVIAALRPPLSDYQCTAKVLNSIAWWEYCLPLIVKFAEANDIPPWVPVSLIGRMGFGGISTPTGILPLYDCWPWVSAKAFQGCDLDATVNAWRIAARMKRHSEDAIQTRMEKLREWIVEFDQGDWTRNPTRKKFFIAHGKESSPFVQSIRKWQQMHAEPLVTSCYMPEYAAWLDSDAFHTFQQDMNNKRIKAKGWKVARYEDDPAPPVDRTLDDIERILDAERRRYARVEVDK
jgi:hypothetical protein